MLDQQPAPAVAAAASGRRAFGSHEHPRALELVAIERELQVPFPKRRRDVLDFGRPRAAVPQQDDPGAVALGDHPLELAVLDRMVLDVHGEARRRGRGTDLWGRPMTAGRRHARGEGRSEDDWRGVSGRRKKIVCGWSERVEERRSLQAPASWRSRAWRDTCRAACATNPSTIVARVAIVRRRHRRRLARPDRIRRHCRRPSPSASVAPRSPPASDLRAGTR